MKKGKLLHPQLSQAIARLGHGQGLTVADCGLPIDEGVERIDLDLTHGVPSFIDTLNVLLSETQVEEVIIADELATISPNLYDQLMARIDQLSQEQGGTVTITRVPHETFKAVSSLSTAVVRTGDCTPYANIVLKSGVAF